MRRSSCLLFTVLAVTVAAAGCVERGPGVPTPAPRGTPELLSSKSHKAPAIGGGPMTWTSSESVVHIDSYDAPLPAGIAPTTNPVPPARQSGPWP